MNEGLGPLSFYYPEFFCTLLLLGVVYIQFLDENRDSQTQRPMYLPARETRLCLLAKSSSTFLIKSFAEIRLIVCRFQKTGFSLCVTPDLLTLPAPRAIKPLPLLPPEKEPTARERPLCCALPRPHA